MKENGRFSHEGNVINNASFSLFLLSSCYLFCDSVFPSHALKTLDTYHCSQHDAFVHIFLKQTPKLNESETLLMLCLHFEHIRIVFSCNIDTASVQVHFVIPLTHDTLLYSQIHSLQAEMIKCMISGIKTIEEKQTQDTSPNGQETKSARCITLLVWALHGLSSKIRFHIQSKQKCFTKFSDYATVCVNQQ